MLKYKKVAVTGSLSSGKSTLCQILKTHGAYLVSADDISHQLLENHPGIFKEVIQLLGTQVLNGSKIDRSKVAQIVFSDEKKLKKLEAILHPFIFEEIEKEYEKSKDEKKYIAFIAEVPLLYETNRQREFDLTLLITTSLDCAKKRYTQSDYDKRIQYQMSASEKEKLSDFIICNNGSKQDLEKKALQFLEICKNTQFQEKYIR